MPAATLLTAGENTGPAQFRKLKDRAWKVSREVLAKYVGVYTGVWARKPRVVEMTLSGDALFVSVAGGEPQRLAPQSETNFSGTGLGYNFIRDDRGIATDVMEIH